MDEEEKLIYSHECKCCFLCFEDEIESVELCHVCKAIPNIAKNPRARIERILSVMDKSLANRLPQILRIIWDELR